MNRSFFYYPLLLLLLAGVFAGCKNKAKGEAVGVLLSNGTCSDGIKNQNETGVDCGGTCNAPCPTCFDGIKNQDETGIDCGGSCTLACMSCSDGIQNQGETGIDCGGPCAPCAISYPENGQYGKNILARRDWDTSLVMGSNFSLAANLPAGTKLKVVMNCLSSQALCWGIAPSLSTWQVVTDFNSTPKTQSFIANGPAVVDIPFTLGPPFSNAGDAAQINVYENGSAQVTWFKKIRWQ